MTMQMKGYKVAGLLFNERSIIDDIETCQDFLDLKWSKQELNYAVQGGILPIGTMIVSPDGSHYMVSISKCKYHLKRIHLSLNKCIGEQ